MGMSEGRTGMKKRWRRIVSVLAAGILTGCGAGAGTDAGDLQEEFPAAHSSAAESSPSTESPLHTEEGTYPIHWDLTELYADTDAWQKDYDRAYAMLDEYDSFVGKLNNVDDILAYMEFCHGGDLSETESRLETYAYLGNSLNAGDDACSTMLNKLDSLQSQETIKTAFFQKEILSIPFEERTAILQDPKLEPYQIYILQYLNPNMEAKSEETIRSEEILEQSYNAGYSAMQAMLYLDVPNPDFTMPDGSTVELDDSTYLQIVSDSTIGRNTKVEASRVRMSKMKPYLNVAASALESTMKENWSLAQLENYDTTREYVLDEIHVDSEVYDYLINGVHEMLPDYQRYLNLHHEALGLSEQDYRDLYTSVSGYSRDLTEYDDAVDEVRDSLEIFGEDYISFYDAVISGGHVDVYPAEGKTTGTFMKDSATTELPYVLFNYGGSFTDVRHIAHEMGQAVYGAYAADSQGTESRQTIGLNQEVTSNLNELLFINSEIEHAESTDEKLYYLENEIQLLNETLMVMTMYAEFEDSVYQLVENGESLSADRLNEMWAELSHTYQGDGAASLEEGRYMWSMVPHFHLGYALYQYAASCGYAAGIYEGFQENGQEAVDVIECTCCGGPGGMWCECGNRRRQRRYTADGIGSSFINCGK